MDDNIQSKNIKRRLEPDAPRGAADAAMATERLRKAAYNQEDSPTEHIESSEQRSISQRVSEGIFSIGQAIKHVFVSDSEPVKQATSSEKTRNDIPSLKIDNPKSEFSGNPVTPQNAQASVEKSDPSSLRGQASAEKQQNSLLDSIKSGHIEGLGNCDVPAGARPDSWNSFSAPQTKTQEAPKQNLLDTIKSGHIEGLGNCDAPANPTQVWQDQMRKMEGTTTATPPSNAVDFKRTVIDSANEQSAKFLDRSNTAQTASQQADSTKGNGLWDALNSGDLKNVGDCELKPGASLPTFVPKSDAKPDPNQNMIMKPASMPAFKQGDSNPGNEISANTAAARKANDGSSGTNYAQGDASKYQAADPNSYSGLARGGDSSARTISATDGGRVFNSDPRLASSDGGRNFTADGRTSFDARTGSDTRIGSEAKFAGIGSDNSASRDFSRATSDARGSIDFASNRNSDAGRIDSSPSFRRTEFDQPALASHSDSRQRGALDVANEPRRIAESDAARSESKASSTIDNEKMRSLQSTNTAEQIPQRGQVADINTARRDEFQSNIAMDRNAQSNRNSFDSNIPFMTAKGSSSASAEAATQAALAMNVFRTQNLDRASTGVNLIAGDQKSVVSIDKVQPLTMSSQAVSDKSAAASIIVSDRSISITTDRVAGTGVVSSSTSTGGTFFDSGKFVRGEEAAAAAGRKDASGLTSSAVQDKQLHANESGSVVKSTLISDTSGRIADSMNNAPTINELNNNPSIKTITLRQGDAFVAHNKTVHINTSRGQIRIAPHSAVYVVAEGKSVAVYNIADKKTSDVLLITSGKKALPVKAGEQVVLADKENKEFEKANPVPEIHAQRTKELGEDMENRIFNAEFSPLAALDHAAGFHDLVNSKNKEDRKLADQILKMAAIVLSLRASDQ